MKRFWLLLAILLTGCMAVAAPSAKRLRLTAPTPTNLITVYSDGSVLVTPATPPATQPTPALQSLPAYSATHSLNITAQSSPAIKQGGYRINLISPNLAIVDKHCFTGVPYYVDSFITWVGVQYDFTGTDGMTYRTTTTQSLVVGNSDILLLSLNPPLPATVMPMNLPPTNLSAYLPAGSVGYWADQYRAVYAGAINYASTNNGGTGPGGDALLSATNGRTFKTPVGGDSGSPIGIPYLESDGSAASMLVATVYGYIGPMGVGPSTAYWQSRIMTGVKEIQANDSTIIAPRIANLAAYSHN